MNSCLKKLTKLLDVRLGCNKTGDFFFSFPQIASHLSILGKAKLYSKFIPKEFKGLSKRQLKI